MLISSSDRSALAAVAQDVALNRNNVGDWKIMPGRNVVV
jgi:hypothetical protein